MLGICYYPEHWSKEQVASDIQKMRDLGIQWVRIGEFAWSLIEPTPGKFEWQLWDETLDLLDRAELKVVLGTPTAAPQMVDRPLRDSPGRHRGRVRKFGSRKHFCFLT